MTCFAILLAVNRYLLWVDKWCRLEILIWNKCDAPLFYLFQKHSDWHLINHLIAASTPVESAGGGAIGCCNKTDCAECRRLFYNFYVWSCHELLNLW